MRLFQHRNKVIPAPYNLISGYPFKLSEIFFGRRLAVPAFPRMLFPVMIRISANPFPLSVNPDPVRWIDDRKIKEAVWKLPHSLHTIQIIKPVQFKQCRSPLSLSFSPTPPPLPLGGGQAQRNKPRADPLCTFPRLSLWKREAALIDFLSPSPPCSYHSRFTLSRSSGFAVLRNLDGLIRS